MKVRIKMRSRIQAGPGIEVANAEANTIISAKAATGTGTGTEGAAVEVVQGSDSKLIKVVTHSTATTPSAFPTILKTVDGGVTTQIGSSGLEMTSSTLDAYITPASKLFSLYSASGSIEMDLTGEPDIIVTRSANSLSIKEIDVCDGGLAKKMLILASDPY